MQPKEITKREIYEMAIDQWGAAAQMLMAIEEMAELVKEICKVFRGRKDIRHIAEEQADVEIMMEQLRIIFEDAEEANTMKTFKINRLYERLQKYSLEPETAEAYCGTTDSGPG